MGRTDDVDFFFDFFIFEWFSWNWLREYEHLIESDGGNQQDFLI